tara:strand:- start:240 stop:941 length:702 start_codon:yes stop_codon:yes gene_type:complete
MNETAKKMFPTLLEVKPLDESEIEKPDEPTRPTDKEIFQKKEKEKVKLEVNNEVITVKKDRYAHLAKARATALKNRKIKAEKKRILKEEQKVEKQRVREEKKKVRDEKNRKKSRERYWELKREKEEKNDSGGAENIKELEKNLIQKAIATENPPPNTAHRAVAPPSSMNYDQFESYMDRYTQKKKTTLPIKVPPPPKPTHNDQLHHLANTYHPQNYPLSSINPFTRSFKKFRL